MNGTWHLGVEFGTIIIIPTIAGDNRRSFCRLRIHYSPKNGSAVLYQGLSDRYRTNNFVTVARQLSETFRRPGKLETARVDGRICATPKLRAPPEVDYPNTLRRQREKVKKIKGSRNVRGFVTVVDNMYGHIAAIETPLPLTAAIRMVVTCTMTKAFPDACQTFSLSQGGRCTTAMSWSSRFYVLINLALSPSIYGLLLRCNFASLAAR